MKNIDKNLHIFIKYNEETGIPGKSTMSEHLNLYLNKGQVIWGHFTNTKVSRNKKGLWKERTKYIDKQLKNNIITLVFFYCRKSKELYVANLLKYYDREEPDTNKELLELIPKYYHDRVGAINEITDINTMRSYAFVRVSNLRKIDFKNTEYIYNFKGYDKDLKFEKVLDSKGMSSLLYVNLEKNFYDSIANDINSILNSSINNKSDEIYKEGILEEEEFLFDFNVKEEEEEEYSISKDMKYVQKNKSRKHSIENDMKNKSLGYVGEKLVLELEKKRVLEEIGKEYVAKIEHVSQVDDGKGYDILSWEKLDDGSVIKKYIEVKTTEGDKLTQFYISSGEVEFSKKNKEQYYLYRVYKYDKKTGNAKFFKQKGSIEENYLLTPKNYVANLK